MEKVLRKRAWRDLKENKFRYFALAFLIIISMYLVISLVGAADTIVDGTTKQAKKHKLEDGQFQVFVPLTTKQKENFTKKGLTVEETFYLDFRQKDGSKLRIFKNRKKVNKINLDEGRLAKNKSEVVVEKRYAQEHNLKTGSKIMGELAKKKKEYEEVGEALAAVKQRGYGVVTPTKEEIVLEEPQIVKHGSKYGVKIKASAPSIHMIRANISTEIAPIVGEEYQAKDLMDYIEQGSNQPGESMWDVNIFGKTLEQLVGDGMQTKALKMTDESQQKLQDTMEKIINESNGGLVCIII